MNDSLVNLWWVLTCWALGVWSNKSSTCVSVVQCPTQLCLSLSRGQSSTVGLGQAVGWVLCCLLDCESVLQSRWVLPVSIISAQQKPVVGEEPWKNPAAGRGRENLWLLNTEILWAWFSKLVEWVWVLLFSGVGSQVVLYPVSLYLHHLQAAILKLDVPTASNWGPCKNYLHLSW